MQNNDKQQEQDVPIFSYLKKKPFESSECLSDDNRSGESSNEVQQNYEIHNAINSLFSKFVDFARKTVSYKDHNNLDNKEYKQNDSDIMELESMFGEFKKFDSKLMVPEWKYVLNSFESLLNQVRTKCCIILNHENPDRYISEVICDPDGIAEPREGYDSIHEDEVPAYLASFGYLLMENLANLNNKLKEIQSGDYKVSNNFHCNEFRNKKGSYNTLYYTNQILAVLKEVGRPMKLGEIHEMIKVDPNDPNGVKPSDRVVSEYLSKLVSCNILETVSPNGRKGFEQKMDGKFYRLKSNN